MLKEQQIEFVRDTGSKFGRFLMGFLFFVSGLSMLFMTGPENVGLWLGSLGVPFAALMAWVVIVFKIVAGGALMVGRYVPEAAGGLIVFTLIATLLAHMDFSDGDQMTAALKNLAIVGGLLYAMAFGPGGINVRASAPAAEPTTVPSN